MLVCTNKLKLFEWVYKQMLDLKLEQNNITSFYDILGDKEDDMTYGLGYVLASQAAKIDPMTAVFFSLHTGLNR